MQVPYAAYAAVLILSMLVPSALAAQDARPCADPTAAGGPEAPICPGDRIALRIWNEPEMSDTFAVAATGRVILPKLGSVRVVDRSASVLQDSLRQAYAVYLRNPSVEVTVLRRIGVQGEVSEPNLYLVDLTTTLRDAIALAGGVTRDGDPGKVTILRGDQRIELDRRDAARMVARELRSGDQIVVGRRHWFERNALAVTSTAAVVVSVLFPILQNAF